jgi:hypothetical protein
MKQNAILFFLSLSLSSLSCKSDIKEVEKLEVQTETKENPKVSGQKEFYVPLTQENIKLVSGDSYKVKYLLKASENYFNLKGNNIHIVIPNSGENMRIQEVFNVSDYSLKKKFNAIVVNITNGSVAPTKDTVTHKLIADLELSKIRGLSIDHMKDGNLKVFIINEDILDDNERMSFVKCTTQETGYSHKECNLDTAVLYEKDDLKPFRPREQEGDIITGG